MPGRCLRRVFLASRRYRVLVLAGLRGKLKRRVRTTNEQLRERLIFQDLYRELDIEEAEACLGIQLAMMPIMNRNSVLELVRKQYASRAAMRRLKEIDPYALKDSPDQAAVRQNMARMLDMLERAGLMEYEEPSDAVKEVQ